MNHVTHQHSLTLSIYPTHRGFAFALFEGPLSPFDWGIREIRRKHKNTRTLESIAAIIEKYHPESLVIEDCSENESRRSSRIRKLYRALVHLAETEHVQVFRYPASAIRDCFAPVGATTKYEIARAIARQIPAFAHRMPRVRKTWMSKDLRQSLFDAVALALVFYQQTRRFEPDNPAEM